MEYRIFGPGGSPPEDFREDLQFFLQLDDGQRNAIAEWFVASRDYNAFASPLPAGIVASTLLPDQFQRAASWLRQLLWSWEENGPQLEDIERDLLLLGFGPEALAVIVPLLNRLATIKRRVWAYTYAVVKAFDGLPTIDQLNFVCEARAVFGGGAGRSDQTGESYKEFLGMIPLVIMEVVTSDAYGNQQRMAIQLSEESFESLQKAVVRAREQLFILKERTASVAFDGNGLP